VRVRVTLRLAIYRQSVRLGDKPLETHDDSNFSFKLNTCGYSLYITSSLTRGWVCRLQLLLALASAVILGSVSHILLSQIRDFHNLQGQVPCIYMPQEQGGPVYTPRHWVPFSSWLGQKSKLLYDWQYNASHFVLASGPLRPTTRDFFQRNSCGNSPYLTSSLTRRWVCLLWICFAFCQVYVSHI
jgi:hypothetical protein